MSENMNFILSEDTPCLFVTFIPTEKIDIFKRKRPKEIIYDNLFFYQERQNLLIHAYVIMPNHLHLLISDSEGDAIRLHKTLSSFRKMTAKLIIEHIETSLPQYQQAILSATLPDRKKSFWVPGWHPEFIISDKLYSQKMAYIHNNPLKAGLVAAPEEWVDSSLHHLYYGSHQELKVNFW